MNNRTTLPMNGRTPPPLDELPDAPIEAERVVLGALILSAVNGDAKCRITAFSMLADVDMGDPDFAIIFGEMRSMHEQGVALEPRLVYANVRDRIPDAAAIIYEAPSWAVTTATVGYYCTLVKNAARERRFQIALRDAGSLRTKGVTEAVALLRADLDKIDPAASDQSTIEMFDGWEADVLNRVKPKLFQCAPYGSKLREVQIGEGHVTLIGAPPGAGKTALTMQLVVDALQASGQEHVKALVANVEMSPQSLWNRQLARLSGVGHQWIQHRDYDSEATERLLDGIDQLRALMPRLEFMRPPFTLENLSERATAFDAKMVGVDYAQRFDFQDRSSDQRSQANAVMDVCRRIADQGRAVIVVSAVNRAGYSKDSAGLASFRESSELEYGADSAYLLIQDEQDREVVTLKCVKNRHGAIADIPLRFDGSRQTFTDDRMGEEWTH